MQQNSPRAAPANSPSGGIGEDPFAVAPAPRLPQGSELLLFQDLPIVVSAARQAQPINLSGVPVSIITADDIHYGGWTRIPDMLQFVPGMDVLRSDRNVYAVGVHGLHHNFADRTLTLINGRDAGNAVFGGADWMVLPVLVEDIERIEVVRGPGGAAWGANAFNGVVNIITKQPQDIRGGFVNSTVDNYGDTYSHLRWADVSGNWAWRISLGYQDQKSSDQALDGVAFQSGWSRLAPLLGLDQMVASDLLRDFRSDSELIYTVSPETRASFGLATSSYQRGSSEFFGLLPDDRNDGSLARAYARLDYQPDKRTSAYVQWFGNFDSSDWPGFSQIWDVENDLETQMSFGADGSNKLTLGGNLRAVQLSLDKDRPADLVGSFNDHEYWGGLFAIDRWQASSRLAVEGQLRGDWYSATGADWSGRLTGLYALDAATHHILRLSAAKAFRAPLVGVRRLDGTRLPLPPPAPAGMNLLNIEQNSQLENEQVYALEAGYSGQFADGLTFRVDGFYQKYDDLIGATPPTPDGSGAYNMHFENRGGADSYGGEAEISYTRKNLKLSTWYGYEWFQTEHDLQTTRSFYPAQQKAGATARWNPGDGWTLTANYRYTSKTYIENTNDYAPSFNSLDLTLAKSLFSNKAEIMLGVEDVFDETGFPLSQDGQLTSHESPGRTFFVRLQGRF